MCKLRIFLAVLALLSIAPPAAVLAGDSTTTFSCEDSQRMVWQGVVTDADGDPVPPGEYTVEYCYYEDAAKTIEIGCCTTTVIVKAVPDDSSTTSSTTVATAALAYPDPWEDTAIVPGHYEKSSWTTVGLAFSELNGGMVESSVSYVFTHVVWLEVSYRGNPLTPMMQIGFLPKASVGSFEKRLNDIEAKVNLLMSERE